MHRLRVNLGALAMAGGTAAIVLAGIPALASTHASSVKSITGPEVIAGAVYGKKAAANSPIIPLRWAGLVNTHSVVNLGGGSGPHKGSIKTLASPAGKLTIEVTRKPHTSQAFNNKSCRFSFTEDIPVMVVGSMSTGRFASASGPGAAQVFFAESARRYHSGPKMGQCNPNGRPIAKTAVAKFLASLVLTVEK